MNAPVKPQTCHDAGYCKYGAETLLKLLSGFESQIGGVIRSDDIEYVHKMRVASRRIRATMPLFQFCFPRKKYCKWLREVKKVTKLLGEARDLDVQVAFITKYMDKLESPSEKASVEPLLKKHKDRRTEIQPSVVHGLEQLKASDFLLGITEFCKQATKEATPTPYVSSSVLERAHWHISYRLNDLLALEEYVHLENEPLKHHEIRILAKWLRYTMEAFAPLYKSRLNSAIETIKAFQDVLGEMHDCDVWIEYISKSLDSAKPQSDSKVKKKADPALGEHWLLNFLTYIKEERKTIYSQFVQLWNENKKKGFFEDLRKTTNTGFTSAEAKMKRALSHPDVKIAVLADIHANLHALEKVLGDAEERGACVFLNAGDSVGFGAYPNEVIEMLNEKNVLSVLGNYDLEVVKGDAKAKGEKKLALEFTRKELTRIGEAYLFSLPNECRLKVTRKTLLLTHGSPKSINEHIYPDAPTERLVALAETSKADIVIVGHSHEQFQRDANGVFFVNPGSVGRPGNGNPQTAYAILSFNPFKVELIRLDYDVAAAAEALRKKALPESFAQMMLRGVALEAILKEDRKRKDVTVKNCQETVKASQKISQTYWQDTEHYVQVSKLALAFFDGLSGLHQLGKRERCWLECAAVLHDVGLSEGTSGHHKTSMKLILNDTRLPFTSEERRIIASIARYHRKGLPKPNHYNLAALDRSDIRKVKMLTSILRVADGLDYTHQSIVKDLALKVSSKKVTAQCACRTDATLEEQAFNKKKDLFEKVFKRKLVQVWKKQ